METLLFAGDYRGLVGEGIPYRSMGYPSLEAYVDHAMYDVCRVSRDRSGNYVLHALATQARTVVKYCRVVVVTLLVIRSLSDDALLT